MSGSSTRYESLVILPEWRIWLSGRRLSPSWSIWTIKKTQITGYRKKRKRLPSQHRRMNHLTKSRRANHNPNQSVWRRFHDTYEITAWTFTTRMYRLKRLSGTRQESQRRSTRSTVRTQKNRKRDARGWERRWRKSSIATRTIWKL